MHAEIKLLVSSSRAVRGREGSHLNMFRRTCVVGVIVESQLSVPRVYNYCSIAIIVANGLYVNKLKHQL